jgi:hypothetical protein
MGWNEYRRARIATLPDPLHKNQVETHIILVKSPSGGGWHFREPHRYRSISWARMRPATKADFRLD